MQTTYLTIIGMTNGDPMNSLPDVLKRVPGVGDVKVSASGGVVTIHFNETRISVSRLTSALEEAGFEWDWAMPPRSRYHPSPPP